MPLTRRWCLTGQFFLSVIFFSKICTAQEWRVWTDTAGRKVSAELHSVTSETATFRLRNGQVKTIGLENLPLTERVLAQSKTPVLLVSTSKTDERQSNKTVASYDLVQSMREFEKAKREVRSSVTKDYTVTVYEQVNEEVAYTVSVPKTVWECVCINGRWVWRSRTICTLETRTRTVTKLVPRQETRQTTEETVRLSFIPDSDDPKDDTLFIESVQSIDLGPLPASAGPTGQRISRVVINNKNPAYVPPTTDSRDPEKVLANTEWTSVPEAPNRKMQALLIAKPNGNDVGVILKTFQVDSSADTNNLQRANFIPKDQILEKFSTDVLSGLKSGLTTPQP